MTAQLPMFIVNPAIDEPDQAAADHRGPAPTCPACRLRPARWNTRRGEWARYCSGGHCSNHEHACSRCGDIYERSSVGSGTRWCPSCKAEPVKHNRQCTNCGESFYRTNTKGSGNRWGICGNCWQRVNEIGAINSFNRHKLPTALLIAFLADPTCNVCGKDLTTTSRTKTSGNYRGNVVVDHDHGCCPKESSCGECVRGILCFDCNTAIGYLHDDPAVALRAAEYLNGR